MRCVSASKLRIGRPEIRLAANGCLEMRHCLLSAAFRQQYSTQLSVRLGVARTKLKFAGELHAGVICIAVFPVKVSQPKMNSRKVGPSGSDSAVFVEGFLILFARGIELA